MIRSQKRLKLQLVDGKIRIHSPAYQALSPATDSFHIVIRQKGRMEVPIKILNRKS